MSAHNGLSFETRCGLAIERLEGYRADIARIQEDSLLKLQEFKQLYNAKPEDPPLVRELKEQWMKEDIKNLKAAYEELGDTAWETALAASKKLFGGDAVAFALAVIEKNTKAS